MTLYERDDIVLEDFVIQTTATSFGKGGTKILNNSNNTNTRKFNYQDVPYKRWKMNAIDGDNTVIIIWLDSILYAL